MNTIVDLMLWGKTFSLPIEYADSIDADDNASIEESIRFFTAHSADWSNASRPSIKAYIEKAAFAIGQEAPTDLFETITPHMLLVGINEGKAQIALLGGFTLDPEHDIAILFNDRGFESVDSQDLVAWW